MKRAEILTLLSQKDTTRIQHIYDPNTKPWNIITETLVPYGNE